MRHKKLVFTVLFVALSSSLCLSQQSTQPLTNQDVIEMVSAGLSDGLIVDKIHAASSTNFDTSVPTLKALHSANVPDSVLRAMVNPKPSASETQEISNDSNDPASPHAPGIYMYTKGEDGMKMTALEPTYYQGAASAGAFLLTFGAAKAKVKAVVRGAHAPVTSNDSNLAFYFYFNDENGSFGSGPWGMPTSPNQFTLLKFEQKSNSREAVIATVNAFSARTGSDLKSTGNFTFTKIKSGVYKVTPDAALVPGEYCFVAPPSLTQYGPGYTQENRLFDFAVLPAAKTSAPAQTSAALAN